MTPAPVNPRLVRWARERSGIARENLAARFKNLPEWESGETRPTMKQLVTFAHAVHVPLGYMFLAKPPEESIPISDFRAFAGQAVPRPSPNLLDTIYMCRERQDWYRDFAAAAGLPERDFVGSATIEDPPKTVAAKMHKTLGFHLADCPDWSEALRLFVCKAEEAGILVMVSGVVASNARRLDPDEFCGFTLSDPLAPLIFVNGAEPKAEQMLTLARELAHLWLGKSALSNMGAESKSGFRREEVWCNTVAAEFLVILDILEADLHKYELFPSALSWLEPAFRVNTLPGAGGRKRARVQAKNGKDKFYAAMLARTSRRFTRALVRRTLEGRTLYRDAFRMLGVSGIGAFDGIAREAGVME